MRNPQHLHIEISGANAIRHAGYPDRHIVHHKIASTVLKGLPRSCDFLLVDTIAEAYEPIIKILALSRPTSVFAAGGGTSHALRFVKRSATLRLTTGRAALAQDLRFWIRQFSQSSPIAPARFVCEPSLSEGSRKFHGLDVIDVKGRRPACSRMRSSLPGGIHRWTVFHSDRTLRVEHALMKQLSYDPLSLVVHVLPRDTKLGRDEAPALLIGRSALLAQLKNLCNIVWYNMDHYHRTALLRRLAFVPETNSWHAAKLVPEARRTPTRLRFDFNETRTQMDDRVQRQVENLACCTSHIDLITESRNLLASRHDVPIEGVQLFRGANEAIKVSILALAKPGWRVLMPDVTYIGHVKASIAARADVNYLSIAPRLLRHLKAPLLDVERLISVIASLRPHVLVLGNPSNPLGDFLNNHQFEKLFKASSVIKPTPIIIIDGAFDKFARVAGATAPDYTKYVESGRIIVIESLSKADGYAGSRAGYIYGSPSLVQKVARSRWGKAEISVLGAATILVSRHPNNDGLVEATVATLLGEVSWFSNQVRTDLSRRTGIELGVRSSFGSFVIVGLPHDRRDAVVAFLKSTSNIDVAYVPRFFETTKGALVGHHRDICGQPLPGLIRISLGRRGENVRLVDALRQALSS